MPNGSLSLDTKRERNEFVLNRSIVNPYFVNCYYFFFKNIISLKNGALMLITN